ncbi:MAG: hypothetical protein QT11_C0001G0769 [archaeon GW2011_AR20]|nr:MAG: hypothetical protein QT11_C0001G0769 [archaeon GW2011_AR20]MBS3160818.1 hypothetical protein [Candidatus Woesearchaeota archaeon]
MQQEIQTESEIDLEGLANKLSKDFNLRIVRIDSKEKTGLQDIDLVLSNNYGFKSVTLSRNYSDNALDFESFSVYYKPELGFTKVIYFTSDVNYFKRTFSDLNRTDNEFLSAVKTDYNKILSHKQGVLRGSVKYEKRIVNNQTTLEELFNYAAFKFKGINSST